MQLGRLVEDRLGRGDPDGRCCGGVVRVDERLGPARQIRDAVERTPRDHRGGPGHGRAAPGTLIWICPRDPGARRTGRSMSNTWSASASRIAAGNERQSARPPAGRRADAAPSVARRGAPCHPQDRAVRGSGMWTLCSASCCTRPGAATATTCGPPPAWTRSTEAAYLAVTGTSRSRDPVIERARTGREARQARPAGQAATWCSRSRAEDCTGQWRKRLGVEPSPPAQAGSDRF